MSQNIFIERIEQQRIKLELSQSEMAKALNMSLSSYKRLINEEISTRYIELPIVFHQLTGVSLYDTKIDLSRKHKLLSKIQDMTEEDLDFLENVIDYINK